jgi:hypothetical protein
MQASGLDLRPPDAPFATSARLGGSEDHPEDALGVCGIGGFADDDLLVDKGLAQPNDEVGEVTRGERGLKRPAAISASISAVQ